MLRSIASSITVRIQVMRVYYDRLVDDSDKTWLYGYLRQVVTEHMGVDFNTLFQHLDFDKDGEVSDVVMWWSWSVIRDSK